MSAPKSKPKIVGVFEAVKFPEFSEKSVIAKLDTGAYSGAIHCSQIKIINSELGTVLEFYPFGQRTPVVCDEFAVRYVKSSNGKRQKRYFIETDVIISGKSYPLIVSLADRSGMKWPVLIGRKFLKQNGFVVDARKPSRYRKASNS